jgi:hypothetical protein
MYISFAENRHFYQRSRLTHFRLTRDLSLGKNRQFWCCLNIAFNEGFSLQHGQSWGNRSSKQVFEASGALKAAAAAIYSTVL